MFAPQKTDPLVTLSAGQPLAPLQPLILDWAAAAQVQLACLRLDQIDPLISGNKWFKLQPYLQQAMRENASGLVSLGGPHSNHLHALAAAGRRLGLATVGLVRGEPVDTPTMRDVQAMGMHLHWLGYAGYRERHQAGFWQPWLVRYPRFVCIDEGGQGLAGAQGCAALVEMVRAQLPALGWRRVDGWWLAVGTGTTLAGLRLAESPDVDVVGALAVPVRYNVGAMVEGLLDSASRACGSYRLVPAARRGFGQADEALLAFLQDAERQTGVVLEPVYTAKALMALRDAVLEGRLAPGSRWVFVHTGGLQGRRALLGVEEKERQLE